jgi:hypothetical protein
MALIVLTNETGVDRPHGNVAGPHSERHNRAMGRERGQSLPGLFSTDFVGDIPPPRLPAEKAAPREFKRRNHTAV